MVRKGSRQLVKPAVSFLTGTRSKVAYESVLLPPTQPGEIRELERSGEIILWSRSQGRDFPELRLAKRIQLQIVLEAKHSPDVYVVLCCATGDESLRDLGIAIAQLDVFFRAEPVGEPDLAAFAFPPHPATEQVSLVGVAVFVLVLVIEKLATLRGGDRIGRNCLAA